jgi:hypothetical protein
MIGEEDGQPILARAMMTTEQANQGREQGMAGSQVSASGTGQKRTVPEMFERNRYMAI